MGLTICKAFAEMMSGEVGVTSTEGKGSTFWFTAALETVTETDSAASDSKEHIDFSGKKVLVAEDNKVNQLVVGKLLEKLNIAYELVENGLEAVEHFKNESYDLVLMDCEMPELNGYEATKQIRSFENSNSKQSTPIIALTANALEENRDLCIGVGMNDHIAKPIQFEALKSSLASQISDRKGAAKRGRGKY